MKQLSIDKYSFGRHETFALRYGWLTKGYQAWIENHEIFQSDEATIRLGVGKNMVNAIRYWLIASTLLEVGKSHLTSSHVAALLMGCHGGDRYMEDEGTIWLIHWLIASNAQDATAFFWFFNRFHKTEFSSNELQESLRAFVSEQYGGQGSDKTLKNDISVLLRSYHRLAPSKSSPLEESLDSPLAELGLIHEVRHGHYAVQLRDRPTLPIEILGFAILSVMQAKNVDTLSIAELMHGDGYSAAPGAVFRLTEEALVEMLERLSLHKSAQLSLRETAGIRQVYFSGIADKNPTLYLIWFYGEAARLAA